MDAWKSSSSCPCPSTFERTKKMWLNDGLCLNYMRTLPTHYFLISSGQATHVETHPYTHNIIHKNHCSSGIIRGIHCSSQYYSLKILFITTLSLKIPTLFKIFLLFIPALFIIHTGVSFFLLSKFLLMKIR
jgi:hypothetical protein